MFSSNPAGIPSRRRSDAAAVEQAAQAFPNVSVVLRNDSVRRSILSQRIEGHAISHLRTPQTIVEASGPKATQAGFGACFKFIWQLEGTMQYEDAHQSCALRPGEMLIAAMAWNYRLEMNEDYEGLVLIFDPMSKRAWQDTVHCVMGKPLAASGPLAAAAGGMHALLRHRRRSAADAPTVESLVDIALLSLGARDAPSLDRPLPAVLLRARLMVTQNIGDENYGPDQLARDMGLSRRSLYNAFGRAGLTPARFIRMQRLERARAEILRLPNASITEIALRNGFSDGASFSHAFKATYDISPRDLRNLTLS
ncbi:helix-turn-helix domain-containing protein [Rhizobium sp. BK251]|uniref:helix-turn-helix domain-containing protein n=1 Tax=Rhizobium sp. BK251 TaxID=2512125 RepID=UPI00104B07CC|nr:helix-turn-helix domain-containing protein [Rhizobium sp. BK251]TCL75991.1 AraC-like DNA-binding protein [Rhizobium sp. BK251]